MTMITRRNSICLLLVSTFATAYLGAQDAERQLCEQRRVAQQERQQQKNDRNQEIRDASSNLRQYASDLKNDNREQVRDLDTEFRLQQVDLRAEHQTRVAASEREFQTKMTSMYMQLANAEEETAKNLKAELVERINHTFELGKQAAEAEHSAKVAIEDSKIALLDERDESIRAEADSLGLNQDYFCPWGECGNTFPYTDRKGNSTNRWPIPTPREFR